ncbi:MAG: hypothetical protein ACLFNT_08480 [Spirochaetales bacterium]
MLHRFFVGCKGAQMTGVFTPGDVVSLRLAPPATKRLLASPGDGVQLLVSRE